MGVNPQKRFLRKRAVSPIGMDIVVWHEMRNHCAEEIIAMFPGLTLADVYAALSYYFDNRQEIEADFAANEALAKELMKEYPSIVPGKRSA